MNKKCIFDENLDCTDCGDCEVCDLDKNKICDNCGKCLELKGQDSKSVIIDRVIEDPEEIAKLELGDTDEDNTSEDDVLLDDYDEDYVRTEEDDIPLDIELIDDIDGLNEIIEDEERRSKITEEKFPGFFVVKKAK